MRIRGMLRGQSSLLLLSPGVSMSMRRHHIREEYANFGDGFDMVQALMVSQFLCIFGVQYGHGSKVRVDPERLPTKLLQSLSKHLTPVMDEILLNKSIGKLKIFLFIKGEDLMSVGKDVPIKGEYYENIGGRANAPIPGPQKDTPILEEPPLADVFLGIARSTNFPPYRARYACVFI